MSDESFSLSAAGAARKDEIFRELVGAQRQRRSRRRAVRIGTMTVAILAIGFAAWGLRRPGTTAAGGGMTSPAARPIAGPTGSPHITDFAVPPLHIAIVRNDPTVLARWTDTSAPDRAEVIGDRELADCLARAGRPIGQIRTPGRFLLASDVPQPKAPLPGSG